MRFSQLFISFFLFFFSFVLNEKTFDSSFLEKGKVIFHANCTACHNGGKNLIIPEKNLKKEALDANGMNTISSITYQVINGKNGMPAFGGRLLEEEIEAVASYVLKQSETNFKEN
jgi:cytochrome c6